MFGYASWETIYEEKTRVLLIEGGSELEAGIPPNLAILVASINNANHDVRVFSLNDYKTQVATGDEVRVNTLQVPPSREDVIYKLKDTDIKEDFKALIKEYQPEIKTLKKKGAGSNLAKFVFSGSPGSVLGPKIAAL